MVDINDVREWFDRADMDLDSAKILKDARYPAPFEVICCLCQQVAEKFLKCVS